MLKQQEQNHATLQKEPELLDYINRILSKRKLTFLFPTIVTSSVFLS